MSAEQRTPRHLIVVLPDCVNQCALNCAISLLQFQSAVLVLTQTQHQFEIRFAQPGRDYDGTLDAVLNDFYRSPQFDTLTCIDATLSFPAQYITDVIASERDFVVACYPDSFDWGTVKAGTPEALNATGNKYNLGPVLGEEQEGYLPVEWAKLGMFCIRRAVLERVAERLQNRCVHSEGRVFYNRSILKGRPVSADEMFCKLWGGPVYARVADPVSRFGSMDFVGSVGIRHALR